jgi:cell division protein FtsL
MSEENKNQEVKEADNMPPGDINSAPTKPDDAKKKMSLGKKIMWIVIAVLVFVIAVQILVADKYQAQVIVIEGEKKVGVNPTTEKLDFGDLSADTSATRYVTLNAGGVGTYVYVFQFGSIAELVKLSENSFTMQKGDEKKLEFTLYMPPSAPVGEKYTGRVWIFKIPKMW